MYAEQELMRDVPGDEDDDDMADEELEELFGRDAVGGGRDREDPVHVDLEADGDGRTEDGEVVENVGNEVTRPSTSDVWNDFKKLYKTVKGKKVRYGAICIHCKKEYCARSAIGTGSLRRHRDKCPVRREKTRAFSQSQISFNLDGSMRNWEYCPMRARNELVRLLARTDAALSFGESAAFEEYIRNAHNLSFNLSLHKPPPET